MFINKGLTHSSCLMWEAQEASTKQHRCSTCCIVCCIELGIDLLGGDKSEAECPWLPGIVWLYCSTASDQSLISNRVLLITSERDHLLLLNTISFLFFQIRHPKRWNNVACSGADLFKSIKRA